MNAIRNRSLLGMDGERSWSDVLEMGGGGNPGSGGGGGECCPGEL